MPVSINDPITLDGVQYVTTQGIREDTSSRGVDLAGALIVATYLDGTTETLTWAALDPYTNGGATGANIDMFFGFDAHLLTTTKLLTSLEINLTPANSVFDITTTMETDLDGINTPTSKNGFPFRLLSFDIPVSGSVVATYSNIVSLAGHPAEGDLYTTMLIDFSGLSTGGVLGAVSWNSDIDTLRTSGDLVPLAPPVTTSTVVDGDDAFSWTSYTDTFDANGVIVLREMTFDNGRQADTTFTDGTISSVLTTDPLDAFGWDTQVITFDPAGLRETMTTAFDNGRVLDVQYQDGIKTLATLTDGLDAYRWESFADTFDTDGTRVSREMSYDDGRLNATAYVGGTRSFLLSTDLEDVFDWITITVNYGAIGQRTAQATTYDDGRVLDVQYQGSIKTLATLTDSLDAYSWDSYVDTFGPDGTRVSREITYDDGQEVFIPSQDDFSFV